VPANPDMLLKGAPVEILTVAAPKLIYGTIVLAAVVGPLRSPLPNSLVVIALCFFSMLAISIAGTYADTIRHDMVHQELTPWSIKSRMLLKPNWVMASTVVPIACFGLSMLGVISSETALAATKGLLIFVLIFFGFLARRLCGGGWLKSIFSGFAVGLLGVIVIQIKVWIKYLPDFYS
jgi:hypothetical protein